MSNCETSWYWSAWHHPHAGGQRQSTTVTAGETLHQSVELHHFFVGYPLVMTHIAIENGYLNVRFPIKNGDVP